jgi:hypothetical protein
VTGTLDAVAEVVTGTPDVEEPEVVAAESIVISDDDGT